MAICLLEGARVTPEMPSLCHKCCLYLSTCMPVIEDGYLMGIECDNDNYCEFCVNYEICGK